MTFYNQRDQPQKQLNGYLGKNFKWAPPFGDSGTQYTFCVARTQKQLNGHAQKGSVQTNIYTKYL